MKKMAKSIVFARNVKKGEKLSLTDVCVRCSADEYFPHGKLNLLK